MPQYPLPSKFPLKIANSLPIRAIMAVSLVMGLVLVTTVGSGILAWIAESDAHAVNTAGSIRMATYRISYLMANDYHNNQLDQTLPLKPNEPIAPQLSDDMGKRLAILQKYQQLQGNQDSDIESQIHAIEQRWTHELQPFLLNDNRQAFYQTAILYVNDVDKLVKQIQARNEKRQTWQQDLQVMTLLATILILGIGLYELQQNVLIPVRQLRLATQKFHQHKTDEQVTVHIAGYDEFNELGESFNRMTATIHTYQNHLEDQVARKTYHLTQSNHALTLLYDFAKELSQQTIAFTKLQTLIQQFAHIMPHFDLSLCLHNEQVDKDVLTMNSGTSINSLPQNFCHKNQCDSCKIKQNSTTWVYPIHSQNIDWGELLVTPKNMSQSSFSKTSLSKNQLKNPNSIAVVNLSTHLYEPSFDEKELLSTLANLISLAFANQRQREQEHQLILFEERNTIARELHDSLAQSLSYLKIQVSLLAKLLQTPSEPLDNASQNNSEKSPQQQKIEQILAQSRDGLNDAYSQLRELLVTFRLKIDDGSFDTALAQACDEFSQKGGFAIHLDNRLMSINLTANEQVDLLQISREALSNINRHAQARHVHVSLSQSQHGQVTLRIQDDGIGLRRDFDGRQHHGLNIMQERSHNLDGKFHIDNVLPHGTAVTVKFLPKLFEKKVI